MLYISGPYLPIRVLEEVRLWKRQEQGHSTIIKAVIPAIEPAYSHLLDEWSAVFGETEAAADSLLRHALEEEGQLKADAELNRQTERLLAASFRQSQEWIRQLGAISKQSRAAVESPAAEAPLQRFIRDSEYFLGALEPLNKPGLITRAAGTASEAEADGLQPEAGALNAAQNATNRWAEKKKQQAEPAEAANTNAGKTGDAAGAAASLTQTDPRPSPGAVPIGGHKLPPLPYPYNALEPFIDEKTMRIHHDKHHQTYVDDLNKAEKKLKDARSSGNFDLVKHWERELAFNGAGHYLHTIFWDIMTPEGGGEPSGALAAQIKQDFGSFDAFKKHFSAAAEKVEGGGWAILVWSPRARRLEILQAEKHQNLSQWDVVPLLPLDVWEHAYYLKHQNNRKAYIEDWWHVVNWPAAQQRYLKARQLQWQPY